MGLRPSLAMLVLFLLLYFESFPYVKAQSYVKNNVPFLGICLGMQIAVIEFARSVLGVHDATSTEFDPETKSPCAIFMLEGSKTHMGGTMRLGSRRTYFQVANSKSVKLLIDRNTESVLFAEASKEALKVSEEMVFEEMPQRKVVCHYSIS
ncbi:hypothetical protein K1719_007593 [Acacia pycnantha]|nr:hypothetical protein K1719_007593 [Acacia pycnantha]